MSTSIINSAIEKLESLSLEAVPQELLLEKVSGISLGQENTGESAAEQVNEAFNKLSSYWQQGSYENIVKYADTFPLSHLCDIRICIYFLYSFWLTQHNQAIERLLAILINVLKHQHQRLLPLSGKEVIAHEKILNNSIGLFFRKLVTRLEKPEVKNKLTRENIQQAPQVLEQLKDVLNSGKFSIGEEVYNLLRELNKYFLEIQVEIDKNDIAMTENSRKDAEHSKSIADEAEIQKFANKTTVVNQQINGHDVLKTLNLLNKDFSSCHSTNTSYSLQLLLQRIGVLQQLIERSDDFKASIVLADIQNELDNFNPLIYFPQYFANFARIRAEHANKLEPYFSGHNTYQWKVLSEYYHADMTAFAEMQNDSGASRAHQTPGTWHTPEQGIEEQNLTDESYSVIESDYEVNGYDD
ncbi:MAG: type VI secretion system protein IglI family protein [Pseudomonadota bacterium]